MADETTTVPEEQALFQLSNGRYIMDEAQSRVMFQIKEAQPEHSHPISGTGYSWDESGMADWTEEYQYDENGVLTKKVSKNFRGMTEEYEYKNDEHGNPIMGNILFVGEEWTGDGIDFCGIEEETFKLLELELNNMIYAMKATKEAMKL